jgi:hypothetical protein
MRLPCFLLGLVTALPACAAGMGGEPDHRSELDPAARRQIVGWIHQELISTYVFLDVAEEMKSLLERKLAAGDYDTLNDIASFAERLTLDLQSVSHDLHLRVRPTRGSPSSTPARGGQPQRQSAGRFGFERVEILDGNIGYLDLRGFVDASIAGRTAHAAMAQLADADALVFDLRHNGGGSPSMIQLLSSYLFDQPVHLNSFYIRSTDRTQEFWTSAEVPGVKKIEVPVWVLTSGRTFSAAEEFTYNLKNLERATVVGETTGGGAHPVELETHPDYPIAMSVPFGRAINPITGTNWEGTGVVPHVEVPADQALEVALRQARQLLTPHSGRSPG